MRAFIFALLSPIALCAAITNVQVMGVTNTQALISYLAPDTSACTVEVSESSSYSPLVNDVNSTYFSGADSDSRSTSIFRGRERIFVAGLRTVATAGSGSNYSRALQAATLHYYRITCGADTATGTFTTATIPFGASHGDPPITDASSTTGGVLVPTPVDVRNSVTIDPRTGAALKRVQVSADGVGATNMGSGASFERCSGLLRTDDNYLCDAFNSSLAGGLYRIHKDTGDATFLGRLTHHDGQSTNQLNPDHVMWSSSDPNCFFFNHSNVAWGFVKVCYSGDGSAVVGSASATLTVTSIKTFTAMETAVEAFIVANQAHYPVVYQASQFTCSVSTVQLDRAIGVCRGQQDTFGWYYIYDIATDAIIAVMPTFAQPVARWCVSHQIDHIGDQLGLQATLQNPKDLVDGNGAYTTTLQADISSSDTNITVSSTCAGDATCANWNDGEPTSATYAPDYLMDAQVGDVFQFCAAVNSCASNAEYGRITAKSDHTHWTISRAARNSAASQTAGKVLRFYCANKPGCAVTNQIQTATLNWNFLADPYGESANMTGVWLTQDVGHTVSRKWKDGSGGIYVALNAASVDTSTGNIVTSNTSIDIPSRYIPQSPYFAGFYPPADGITFQKHPYANSGVPWVSTDVYPFVGANLMAQNGVLVAGLTKVYRVTTDSATDGINYKHFAMFGASGTTALRDVSGPSSVLDDSAGKDFTMCKVLFANECVSGSTAGQLYVQIPSLALTICNQSGASTVDICVGDFPVAGSSAIQTYWNRPNKQGVETSLAGTASRWGIASQRTLAGVAKGISYRNNTQFDTIRILPNGKWALSMRLMPPGATPDYWTEVLKIPPTIFDSVNRTTFIPVQEQIGSVPSGTNNIIAEFGYAENGSPASFYCTQRTEACVAVSSTVNETTPFYFASESYTGLSCASGCTITLPGYPGRVIYWRVKYRDASNNVIATSPIRVGVSF